MQATPEVCHTDGAGALHVLGYLHRLLLRPASEQPSLDGLLAELAAAFRAPAAGLASLPEGALLACHPAHIGLGQPWDQDPSLLVRASRAATALTVNRPAGGSWLITGLAGPEGNQAWVLWLEDAGKESWSDEESASLALAASVVSRRLAADKGPRWADQLDRLVRQQKLETAAGVTRRLAHDFGNVLTGILGFTELALAQQVPSSTPLHSYLNEAFRSAQSGAQFVQALRLFSRRQAASSRPCSLASALAAEEARLQPARDAGLHLSISVPDNLPQVAMDADQLRAVLGALLDNAHEALVGPGSVSVSARLVDLSAADALDSFGDVRPGPHVEVCIADTGGGLLPEAQKRLFCDPFFTTKPRRRGFGLAVAYGLLHAHHGGLRLYASERGVVACVVVPVSPTAPASYPTALEASAPEGKGRGEKVLVVDDDPMILKFVSTTLERAGYRVLACSSAEDALHSYFSQGADPFRLLLSDVVMPRLTGVDLVRRLLKRDAAARVLFMSGHVSSDFTHPDFAQYQFELLTKPFRPEGLLRAVRTALDRPALRRGFPTPASPGDTPSPLPSPR